LTERRLITFFIVGKLPIQSWREFTRDELRDLKLWHITNLGSAGPMTDALQAIRGYRFKPAMKDGKLVAVFVNVEVNFRLF
jgi:hypothetical protein